MSALLFKNKQKRDVALREKDEKALHTLVQAAVNVELFTIPLYMTSLYSLQGMHEINSRDSSVYKGRIWPGMSATSKTVNSNELAYNAVFSVFVAEMLHLQIVSNLAKAVAYDPKFTCEPLQDEKTFAWKCYSPDSSVLPGILDFKDTNKPDIRVNIGPMNLAQMDLFLAIEQTEEDARHMMTEEMFQSKYNQQAPYEGWEPGQPLPWFGSIGNMYMQLWKYLSLEYTDGKTLWDVVFAKSIQLANPGVEIPLKPGDNRKLCPFLQQEVFNPGRLDPEQNDSNEYPGMPTSINTLESEKALLEVLNMINGITDQGEGAGVVHEILSKVSADRNLNATLTLKGLMASPNLMAVQNQFQPSCPVLRKKYPSFNADGKEVASAKANARGVFGKMDHFETFEFVKTLIESGGITTWDQWHADGNK
ncbi:MAG: ferritin-like domain-containing protein, partial [Mucilaginibacter sp.]|uniref:ferritin-like domain-containing protein n=1 Tax=Mucilaginibacter sp. TaxID=1882438 RepID=UPI0035617A32